MARVLEHARGLRLQVERRAAAVRSTYVLDHPFNSFNDLGPYDRCISRGPVGSVLPVIYNNGNQIIQTPGYVIVRIEMIHEVRVIPLDGRAHLPPSIRQWMGDSRGHWDGDTLVVETTNLNGRTGIRGNGNQMPMSTATRIVERLTRTGPDTIQYRMTVDDPRTWTRPWTITYPLRRDPAYGMFEYACHEGNYAMRNMLTASRAADATTKN